MFESLKGSIWLWLLHHGTIGFHYPKAFYRVWINFCFVFLSYINLCLNALNLMPYVLLIPIFHSQGVRSVPLQLQYLTTLCNCRTGKMAFMPILHLVLYFLWRFPHWNIALSCAWMKMGSSFKRSIFEEHIQHGLVEWAHKAKLKTGFKKNANGPSQVGPKEVPPPAVQLAEVVKESAEEKGNVGEIHPATGSGGSKWTPFMLALTTCICHKHIEISY